MLLENKFYQVLSVQTASANEAVYEVELCADCEVYEGHFPGRPVSPGVCNIEMIKECACLLTGQDLRITTIKQCRLTAIASPQVCPRVQVWVSLSPVESGYALLARISDVQTTYMEFKGELKS